MGALLQELRRFLQMGAKDILVKPIDAKSANAICKRFHYSGKVAAISQIHLGVFYNGRCEGVMQYGPPIDRRKLLPLVKGTKFNDFLELNRMAFSDNLPRFSESRAIGIAHRMLRKRYPHIKWIVSFSDATQCGDGTIYRASNFILTAIRRNSTIYELKDGEIAAKHGTSQKDFTGAKRLDGFQLRYIYFLDPSYRKNLTVEEIPYSMIKQVGASMYKGIKRTEHEDNASTLQVEEGGSTPTCSLHSKEAQE